MTRSFGALKPHALLGLILLTTIFLSACQKKPAPAATDLSIYVTCDTRGRLVPCGCFTGQYGGLTRLKTVLDSDSSTNSLRVDVGDAIAGREDFEFIQYKYLLRAYGLMGFDALNIGHREAQLSAAQLRQARKDSPVPLLSANLLDKQTRAPLFDAYRLVQREGRTIALVGVLDPHGLGDNLGEGLTVEKMEVALARVLPVLKGKADLIVLLAFTDEAGLAALAREFYELDVVLGGKVSQPSQQLGRENRAVILHVTNESRALGILRAKFAAKAKLADLTHEIMLMREDIPQHDAIGALAKEYRDEVRAARLAVDDPKHLEANSIPGVRTASAFAGTESCVTCHQQATEIWKKTGHADAFATLAQRKADADPNCIGCHTVGFGSASGYRREFAGKKLADVGCESCHGPGSLHVEQHRAKVPITFKFRPLGAGDCRKCHHGEFSRPFDWELFWPHIKHGKEPVKTAARP